MQTDTQTIDITGLDKAEVLAALYNASQPQGLGFLQFVAGDMTVDDAQRHINGGHNSGGDYTWTPPGIPHLYFDYLMGRVMKIDLTGDELRVGLYDRDNGDGAALRALQPLLDARAAR